MTYIVQLNPDKIQINRRRRWPHTVVKRGISVDASDDQDARSKVSDRFNISVRVLEAEPIIRAEPEFSGLA